MLKTAVPFNAKYNTYQPIDYFYRGPWSLPFVRVLRFAIENEFDLISSIINTIQFDTDYINLLILY